MKDATIPLLIVGLVVAFAAGFVIGERVGEDGEGLVPSNWDPSREGLRVAQENSKACYALLEKYILNGPHGVDPTP
jgi:hypothetical protein